MTRPFIHRGGQLAAVWIAAVLLLFAVVPFFTAGRGANRVAGILTMPGGPAIVGVTLVMAVAAMAAVAALWRSWHRLPEAGGRRLLAAGLAGLGAVFLVAVAGLPAILGVAVIGELLLAGLLMLAAGAFGRWFLVRVMRMPEEDITPAEALGAGLAAAALMIFGLALAHLLARWLCIALTAVVLGFLHRHAIALVRGIVRETTAGEGGRYAGALAAVTLFILITLLTVPPLDYDVLEYHLAVPRHYAEAGGFIREEGNVYAAFPMNAEMLSLGAMVLGGTGPAGWFLAKSLNFMTGLVLLLAVFGLGRRWWGPRAGYAAALLMAVSPWFAELAVKEYVELLAALFTVLAAGRLIPLAGSGGRVREFVLAGIFCGAAAGTKYTALPFVAVPFGLALAWGAARQARTAGLVRAMAGPLVWGLTMLAVLAPWLIKNAVVYGNPVFPLLTGLFGGGGWGAEEITRFNAGHAPGSRSPLQFVLLAARELFFDRNAAPLFILCLPFGLWLDAGRRRWAAVCAFGAAGFILWFFTTHQVGRFLFPTMAVVYLAAGAGCAALFGRMARAGRIAVWAGAWYGLLGAVVFYLAYMPAWTVADGRINETRILPSVPAWQLAVYLDRNTPPEAAVLLVGEAQTFYLDRRAVYATVFDRKWIEGVVDQARSVDDIVRALRGRGLTHVYVDWTEMERFALTYGEYFTDFNWALFEQFLAGACDRQMTWGRTLPTYAADEPQRHPRFPVYAEARRRAAGQYADRYPWELYRLK
ncbi:MAG: glycosyltransferase family 39 protein [Planctomycetota bacterium]